MLKASRVTFILLLFFAPLAFGSVESWAFFFLVLLTGAAFFFYFVDSMNTGRPFYHVPGLIPLFLLALFMVLQIIPLPDALLNIISPCSLLLWQKTAGLFNDTAWPVSLDIKGSVYELSRFLVCCMFYVLAIQLMANGKMLKRTVLAIVFYGGFLAFFSILQSIFTVDRVLWFRKVPANAYSFGTYVCRNHYAGLMEMIFPVAVALAGAYRPPRQFGTRREKVLGFFDNENVPLFILLCFSAVIMALSVFMSLSKGGIISLCLSLLFFVLVVPGTGRAGRKPGLLPPAIIIFCVIVLAFTWFGWGKLDQRFSGLYDEIISSSPAARYQILKSGLHMFKDFPMTGAGFGSFGNVFPKYHTVAPYRVVDQAHNDYLQLLLEGGIVGLLFFLAFFASLFVSTYNGFKKRKETYAILVCLGAVTGLVAIFCHSFIDFNLHINANTLYFSFLCALMVSAAHTRFRPQLVPGTYLPTYKPERTRPVMIFFVFIWIPLLVFSAGQWAAAYYTAPFKKLSNNDKIDPALRLRQEKAAERASLMDPLEASYRVLAGDLAFSAGNFSKSLDAYRKAIDLQPTRSDILQKSGLASYYANKDVEQADALMKAGIAFYPAQPIFYGRYAAFLLKTGRMAAAREFIRKGLSLDPNKVDIFFNIMRNAKMTPVEMFAALTDSAYIWYRFAAYIVRTDYSFMQKEVLQKALDAAEREANPPAGIYLSLARLNISENNYDDAITVLNKGISKLPHNISLLYELAVLYEKLQITYKAEALYTKILMVDPAHAKARIRLENLKR